MRKEHTLNNNRSTIRYLGDCDVLACLAAFFLILTFAIKVFTDGPYLRGEVSSAIAYSKYATALIACFFGFAGLIKRSGKLFSKETNKLLIVSVLFFLVSIYLQAKAQHVSTTVFIELIKLVMPVLLAYCILNALDERMLFECMKIILVISFIGYLVDMAHEGISLFDIFSADFSKSQSATEHSGLAGISLVLSLFFLYFDKQKWPLYLSVAFCLLTFKRLAMLVVLTGLIVTRLFPSLKKSKVPKCVITVSKIATITAVFIWYWLLLPQQEQLFIQLFNENPFDFTSGRSGIMRWLIDSGFVSYGFGSANDTVNSVFGVPFEMDFIKIAFELSPILMCVFIWAFWDVAGDCFWGYFIVAYFIINMITSDSLSSNFSFTLAYISIGLINYASDRESTSESFFASSPVLRR